MKFEHVLELVNAVSGSEVTSFEYEEGETKICIKKDRGCSPHSGLNPHVEITPHHEMRPHGERLSHMEEREALDMVESKNTITSPLVGTFYVAPSEEAEPFVKIGDTIKKGQTLAIIEAMKLMNEIESEQDGLLTEILVTNGQGVEYGQPLFIIEQRI